ncbi:YbaB/EbfC family nucleoid-associated protein [Actinosynnema sp. NPDC023794]
MNQERMIADLEARARHLAERSRELRDRIRRAQATQRSPDGAVTATVAPNGSLRHIEFSPDAAEFSHARLGEVVMDTVRRAQELAARQAASIVEPQFGGTAAMDFLTGSVPAVPVSVPEPVSEAGPAAVLEREAGADLPLPRSLRAPEDEPGSAPR